MELRSAQLKRVRFEPLLESVFDVEPDGANAPPLQLTLKEINSRPAPPRNEQYALLFEGPGAPMLTQGIYIFSHPALESLPLFMVPVGRNESGALYEVCVARRTEDD